MERGLRGLVGGRSTCGSGFAHSRAHEEALKLNEDELAFYDALEVNDSSVKVLGEPTLIKIAREVVETVRKNVTIDWTVRENVRAQLWVIVNASCASMATARQAGEGDTDRA
jgi:ABC-type transporter MlaC component